MEQLDKVFLGNTPSIQRVWLFNALNRFRSRGVEKVFELCCGQFPLTKLAIEAGYEKTNLEASDISLFSSLLGYLYSGQPIESLPFTMSPEVQAGLNPKWTQTRKVAYLMYVMRMATMPEKFRHQQSAKKHLTLTKDSQIDNLERQLEQYRAYYSGIHYSVGDMRGFIDRKYEDPEKTLVIINPPAFKGGYERMFDFKEKLSYNSGVANFDFNSEYRALWEKSLENDATFIWYRFKSAAGFDPKYVLFGREYKLDHHDYWMCSKPERLESPKILVKKKAPAFKPLRGAMIVPQDYKITENTKVTFKRVKAEVGLYYRDLWAHKMGVTSAEHYFLMLMDGMVFGTVGIHAADISSLKSDTVHEVFGFDCPIENEPKSHRLLMLSITTQEFADMLANGRKNNRIFEIKYFQTTCLSKYRKMKGNNGILAVRESVKAPKTNLYHIVYVCEFRKEKFSDAVKRYVRERETAKEATAPPVEGIRSKPKSGIEV